MSAAKESPPPPATMQIDGGTLWAADTSPGAVVFTAPIGVLELGRTVFAPYSTVVFTGTVTGLSTSGTSSLDLLGAPYFSGITTAT